MASPHELSGDTPGSPYAKEVETLNTRVFEYAASKRIKELLQEFEALAEEYPGLINREAIPVSTFVGGQRAGKEALERRKAGRLNDSKSVAPGIFVTGVVEYQAIEEIREELNMYRVPYELVPVPEDMAQVSMRYSLHLPQGHSDVLQRQEY